MNPRRGRRVYAGLVVVLVSAMIHGLKLQRMQRLREVLEIDRRTLERWRQRWRASSSKVRFGEKLAFGSCRRCAKKLCPCRCASFQTCVRRAANLSQTLSG